MGKSTFYNDEYVFIPNYTTVEDIRNLQIRLSQYGIECYIESVKDGFKVLHFKIPVKMKNERFAGKPTKSLPRKYSIEEINIRIKNEGAEAVAKDLGIGRSTLYYKIKKAKNEGNSYLY